MHSSEQSDTQHLFTYIFAPLSPPSCYHLHTILMLLYSTDSGCCEFCCCCVTLSGFLISPHCNVFCKMGRREPTPKGRLRVRCQCYLSVHAYSHHHFYCERYFTESSDCQPYWATTVWFKWQTDSCPPDPDSTKGTML